MEVAFFISSILIVLFALLALYDGFYLHILKYKLHNNRESRKEHLTHTIRAILFPCILYFLFLKQDSDAIFYIGMFIVVVDIIVLGIDAFLEKDSRQFMGGLPRWEYILHLFVNGFHFSSIAVFLSLKLKLTESGITIVSSFQHYQSYGILNLIVNNLLPGAILIALVHLFVSIPKTALIWNKLQQKLTCC